MKLINKISFAMLVVSLSACEAASQLNIDYEGRVTGIVSSGQFSPFYISSLQGGKYSNRNTVLAEAIALHRLDLGSRLSYGFGVDLLAGYRKGVDYQRYFPETKQWGSHKITPASAWVQQLYGEVKYRGAFLLAGMKHHTSALLNQELTSGDYVESGNAMPIPEIRAGFVDFQDVPFTKGWLQIQGEIGFGKMLDSDWVRDQFNHYNGLIGKDEWYNYKRCYFKIGTPSHRWSVIAGMQAAAMFGGTTTNYKHGIKGTVDDHKIGVKDFFKMWLPLTGGDNFYQGNHLGSWDFRANVNLDNGTRLSAYFQWPWEDGSGIGRVNGWDGIWGLGYKAPISGWVSGVVVEFLDFTNQSGPMHFAPGDYPGITIKGQATGADNYYNNGMYNSYSYYGLPIGTPVLMGPFYNLDGYPQFVANRMRGFHIGVQGNITSAISYRFKGGYRKGWGNGRNTLINPIHLSAFMLEGNWMLPMVRGLNLKAMVEVDRGKMPCNNVGAMISICYNGALKIR